MHPGYDGDSKENAMRISATEEFSETYKEWIDAQNEMIDRIGVFGEEFRPW